MPIFKGLRQKTAKVGKSLFGYDQLSTGFKEQSSMIRDVIKYDTKKIEAKEDVYIPRKQVEDARHGFKILIALFIGLFVLGLIYAIANFIATNWITGLLSLAFSALCLSFAFRYHFWLYQIKKQTLGLNFDNYNKDEIENRFFAAKKAKPNKKDKK